MLMLLILLILLSGGGGYYGWHHASGPSYNVGGLIHLVITIALLVLVLRALGVHGI